MRRILIVVPHLYGSMRLLADNLRYLDPDRNRVTVLVLDPVLTLREEFPPQISIRTVGNDVARSGDAGYPLARQKLTRWMRCFVEVWSQARQHDLVVSWSELTPTYVTAAAAFLARKPVIGWVHIHLSRIFQLGIRPGWAHSQAIRLLYPALHRVVGCSRLVSEDLRSTFGLTNVTCISNTVDFQRVRQCGAADIDDDLKPVYTQPTPVLINVAALEPQKAHDVLLRAHARVRTKGLMHHLVFVGEGTRKQQLRDLAVELGVATTVHFAGFRKNPYSLIARSTAFVLSSHMEGLPLVLAEALALGIPVVSTDCESGPREVLQDGRLGLLVPVNDDEKLAQAIERILTEAELRNQFTQRDCRHADAASSAEHFESLFAEASPGKA